MPTTPSLWTERHTPTDGIHAPLVDEPMRSLLMHRLDDLERRLVDMSRTMDLLLRQPATAAAADAPTASARSRPELAVLAEVRAARARLEAGSYGLCTSCDAPIESHRLAGRPQLQHCGVCEPPPRRR